MKYSYGDYRTNEFHSYAKHYKGNFEELKEKLLNTSKSEFKWYWQFNNNFVGYLNDTNHYRKATRYLLWKYENHLRNVHKVAPMPVSEFLNKFEARNLDNTLEHITPVNPEFTTYSDDFRNQFLNNIGNLVLMTLGKNAQLNNNSPIDKSEGFLNSTLLSQKEIGDLIKSRGKWDESEIKERQSIIISFAKKFWRVED